MLSHEEREKLRGWKPLGKRLYGSIPHLWGSAAHDTSDYFIQQGQHDIAVGKTVRRVNGVPIDTVYVMEKLDGSCVGVARVDGQIIPLIRRGYVAMSNPQLQFQYFAHWVFERAGLFEDILTQDGEVIVGEWLALTHGTIYDVNADNVFCAFDFLVDYGQTRLTLQEAYNRIHAYSTELCVAPVFFEVPLPPKEVISSNPAWVYGKYDAAGRVGEAAARTPIEGFVYRVETEGKVNFLAKYVRPGFVPGKYLFDKNGNPLPEKELTWNWRP